VKGLRAAWFVTNYWQRALVLGCSPFVAAVVAFLLPNELAVVKVALAFSVLLLYPGWLLALAIGGQSPPQAADSRGRAGLAVAFGLSIGLWMFVGGLLQWVGSTLAVAGAAAAIVLGMLALAAARAPFADQVPKSRRKRRDWLELALFWGSVLVVVVIFAQYAAVWRPTDRWTYAGVTRSILDTGNLQPTAPAPNIALNPRLDLSPWLVQLALLVRMSGVELTNVYSFYVPPLLLVVALCAIYGLARAILSTRWAASLAVAVLVILWMADIGVPALAAFPWQERMLLRIEGGEASVGQWALLGRIIEDKFLLLFILLPVALSSMWRYFLQGGRRSLAALAILLAGVVIVHPLGVVYFTFGFAGFALLRCVQRPSRPIAVRGLAIALLIVVSASVPALQSVQLATTTTTAGTQPLAGQAFLDAAIDYGIWAAPWSEFVYAAHPGLLIRRDWLVTACILLIVLLFWRGWRRPASQFLAGSIGVTLLVAFNPILAPWLAQVISRVFLARMAWPLLLPGVLVLAMAVEWLLAWLRLRRNMALPQWGRALFTASILIGLLLWQAPRVASGLGLLGQIQAAALAPADIEVLQFLRLLDPKGSTLLAEEWLTNELPAFVGHMHGIAFRGKDSHPGGYRVMRDFYDDDLVDVGKLQVLDQYGIDFAVAPLESALDAQLSQLAPAISAIYHNKRYRVYTLRQGWQKTGAMPQLLQAGRALTEGDSTSAIALAEVVLRSDQGDITARQVLSAALALQGRHDEALAALQPLQDDWGAAPWVGPLVANVYRLQAAIAEQRGAGRSELADAYRSAFAADPANLYYGRELAALNAAAGGELLSWDEREEIIGAFEAAAILEPNLLSYQWRSALWALGDMYELLGRPEKAEAAYRKAFSLTRPGDTEAEAVERLGRFLVRQGQGDEARGLYAWALERNPNASVLYAALADLEELYGYPEAALLVWRSGATANPWALWPYIETGKKMLEDALDALH
jgi:tetratricopeptide (TPR) repeat protein